MFYNVPCIHYKTDYTLCVILTDAPDLTRRWSCGSWRLILPSHQKSVRVGGWKGDRWRGRKREREREFALFSR